MSKMSEDDLLALLEAEESAASSYVHGVIQQQRDDGVRSYMRQPYGDEVEGESSIVTSDVQDAVQWVLPSLLRTFTGGDEAVSFEPMTAKDVESAQQVTDACNYVFYKQNNGFLVLHNAFHDALVQKNCAGMWRWKEETKSETITLNVSSIEELVFALDQLKEQKRKPEVVGQRDTPSPDGMTPPMMAVEIRTEVKKGRVHIEAFPPEQLLVSRTHTSPLLDQCRYVARVMPVTLSDVREMGFDIEAEDVDQTDAGRGVQAIAGREDEHDLAEIASEDETATTGYLRVEFVLADYDGDGIAERRMVYRLGHKILYNEPCEQVQIATGSPILIPHQWSGMSLAEAVDDIQRLHTTLMRQSLNSLYAANNPRKNVLVGPTGDPLANIDDLLNPQIGGIQRVQQVDAVTPFVTPWVGAQVFPMLEYVGAMRENRTGVTKYNQGQDSGSLNKTATGVTAIMNASQARIDLIARCLAETFVKPMFLGIFRLVSKHQMEPLSFRLRDRFVEYSPQEWAEQYDMSINVGLGTGNKDQQLMHLMTIAQSQSHAIAAGGMGLLVTPKNVYNVQAKIAENAGFKAVADFWTDPGEKMPEPPPDPNKAKAEADLQKTQMQVQADQQKHASTLQADQHKFQAETQVTAQSEERRMVFEAQQKALDRMHQKELEQMRMEMELEKFQIAENNKKELAHLSAINRADIANLNSSSRNANQQT
jgi:hypothetical protein